MGGVAAGVGCGLKTEGGEKPHALKRVLDDGRLRRRHHALVSGLAPLLYQSVGAGFLSMEGGILVFLPKGSRSVMV